MKLLIVDDEPPARAKLRRMLQGNSAITALFEAGDAVEALAVIARERPDAALLDIQMPGQSGLELALALPAGMVCAFSTAFDQYAVKAFELNAVDYLLKPFGPERLAETLQRLLLRLAQPREPQRGALLSALTQIQPLADFWLVPRSALLGGGLMKLPLDQVEWVAAADNYIELHVGPEGSSVAGRASAHLVRHTLTEFLAHPASQGRFVRVHRSHAVNLAHIVALASLAHGEAELTLTSGGKLRVSRGFRAALLQLAPAPVQLAPPR